jgi:hypothetical protein
MEYKDIASKCKMCGHLMKDDKNKNFCCQLLYWDSNIEIKSDEGMEKILYDCKWTEPDSLNEKFEKEALERGV